MTTDKFISYWQPQNTTRSACTQLPDDPLNMRLTRLLTNPVKGVVMIILFTLLLTQTAFAQTQTIILTSGSSWTVPSNVYSITVECWGGGGGGSNTTTAGRSGGGGGGGAYAKKNTITVTPGNSISYSIGGGGSGSSAGGDTWFNSTSTVLAKGGSGGASNGTSGGTGGSAAASVGDVKYDGGKGGNGTGTGCCDGAGGGGSGAGSTGNGNAGSNGSSNTGICTSGNDVSGGGLKVDYGGDGGVGVGYDGDGGGAYGYSAGGGGAKSGCAFGTNRTGGSGKQGLIRITYCYSPSSTNAGADVTICSGGSTTLSGSATAYSGISQLLLQDFENSLTGWSITNTGTSSASFTWTYGPVSTGRGTANSGNPSLIWANGDNSSTNSSTTLTSPSFSTVGYSSLNLTFRHHYDDYDGGDFAYVEVYNGSSWVTVQTYTTDQGALTNFATASVNLNSYVGISNFAIRFRYVNNNDWHWLIDDISVTGNMSPAVSYSWSPATGLSATNIANPTASPSSTITYTLKTSHNGCSVTSDDVVVTVRPQLSPSAIATLAQCADPTNPYAELVATAPGAGIAGIWTKPTSGHSGTINNATSYNTANITGLSTTGGTTDVQWTLYYTSAPACSTALASPLSITPTSLANIGQVSLQSTGSPQYYNCRTCSVKDGNTYAYFDNSGKIIATIEDPSSPSTSLGITEVCTGFSYNPSTTPTSTDVSSVLTNYADQQPYLPRYWSIDPATKTGQSVTVTLYFTAAEYNALKANASTTAYAFNATSELAMTKYPNGSGGSFIAPGSVNGTNVPITIATYNSDYSVTFVVSSFSTFYIHPQRFPFAPLPVELVSFTGYNDKDKNVLNWATASELNSNRFEIEKSIDGSNWQYIGMQKAAGTTNSPTNYTFYDNMPVMGNNYYRLKIVDNDASYEYSNIINIKVGETEVNGIASVYPNPTDNEVTVVIQTTNAQNTVVSISNVLGQEVMSVPVSLVSGVNKVQLQTGSLPAGTYMISYTDQNAKRYTEKLMKK